MGIIPGMQDKFTIQKQISVIHHINKLNSNNNKNPLDYLCRFRQSI